MNELKGILTPNPLNIRDRFLREDLTDGSYEFVVVYLSVEPSVIVGRVISKDEECVCVVSEDSSILSGKTGGTRRTVFRLKDMTSYTIRSA